MERGTGSTSALPDRLSPSRAKEFDQCPRRFWFGTVHGCTTPPTAATLKGTLVHTVFEWLFDLPREERTAEAARSYVQPVWSIMIDPHLDRGTIPSGSVEAKLRDATGRWGGTVGHGSPGAGRAERQALEARAVIPVGSPAEAALLADSDATVKNYFDEEIERVWNFDPFAREHHLEADVGGLLLHGFIDRLDRYSTSAGEERWVISDYKTGKLPRPQYLAEAFFAMRVYALLLAETEQTTPYELRLLYVAAPKDQAVKRLRVDVDLLESTRATMTRLWRSIVDSEEHGVWEARTGPLCGWCHFKQWCPAFGGDPEAAPLDWLEAAALEQG